MVQFFAFLLDDREDSCPHAQHTARWSTMSRGCSICALPQVDAIDAALAGGASIRAAAADWSVSRSSLNRHAKHAAQLAAPVRSDPATDQLAAALDLLERARSQRERVKALESVRSALKLSLKDFTRSRAALRPATEEQMAQMRANLEQSWAAFEAVKDGGHDLADRALAGVRSALDTLRSSTAASAAELIEMRLAGWGEHIATMPVSADVAMDHYRIPEEFRDCEIVVQMSWHGEPGVEALRGGELVWSRTPKPSPRLLAFEPPTPPGNGNGNGNGGGHP